LVSSQPVADHPRVTDLTFTSAALGGPVHADVLLPRGYDPASTARYPVLYLLHGHGGHYSDWVNHGVDAVVGDLPAIVVMPDGGYDGFYSDWYGSDLDGHTPNPPPAWETFHLRELLPWVDATYRTITDRSHRAIAGLSMGGFGSTSYPARHPDLFVAAGAFSGAVDTDLVYPVDGIGQTVASNLPDQKPLDFCIWGDPVTQDVVWRDHDPTELVRNLRPLSLYQASGNGQPGRYDDPSKPNPGASFTEFGIWQMNMALDRALTADGIAHTTDFYGNGTHSWPYWLDDLRAFLPQMTAAFAAPPPAPPDVPFSFESAGSPFSVWGWTFTPHRDVVEMIYLSSVSASGLVAAGSGVLHVDTAPLYKKNARYQVTGAGPTAQTVTADKDGRLHFDVDLGPSHVTQQYVFGSQAESTFTHAAVRIRQHK
jgi:S-formylglutathione hydrolase FrmB